MTEAPCLNPQRSRAYQSIQTRNKRDSFSASQSSVSILTKEPIKQKQPRLWDYKRIFELIKNMEQIRFILSACAHISMFSHFFHKTLYFEFYHLCSTSKASSSFLLESFNHLCSIIITCAFLFCMRTNSPIPYQQTGKTYQPLLFPQLPMHHDTIICFSMHCNLQLRKDYSCLHNCHIHHP